MFEMFMKLLSAILSGPVVPGDRQWPPHKDRSRRNHAREDPLPPRRPARGLRRQGGTTLDTLLVRVDTDRGLTGWGQAFGYNVNEATEVVIYGFIGPLAVGRDATDIAGLNHDLQKKTHNFGRNGSMIYVISGLDIAGSAMDFHHMFSARAVTFAQPSVTKIGGITELRYVDLEARLIGDATDSRGGEMRVPQGLGLGHNPTVVARYGAT